MSNMIILVSNLAYKNIWYLFHFDKLYTSFTFSLNRRGGKKKRQLASSPLNVVLMLYIWLGKDHKGSMVGKCGVHLGMKKSFGKECLASQPSASMVTPHDLESFKTKINRERTKCKHDKLLTLLVLILLIN